jgi:hypothetical protein
VLKVSRNVGNVAAVLSVALLAYSRWREGGGLEGLAAVTPLELFYTGVAGFVLAGLVCVIVLLGFVGPATKRARRRSRYRERRTLLRHKIWLLRRVVSANSVRLEVFETVRKYLAAPPEVPCGGGFLERRRCRRYARLLDAVRGVMDRSKDDSLTAAVSILTRARSDADQSRDQTLSVWYLAADPENYAVRRLLFEYVPLHAPDEQADAYAAALSRWYDSRGGSDRSLFVHGVVVTPRWVYELAVAGERGWRYDPRIPDAFSDECVPIGDTDMETLCALYEPGGAGPLGSLAEAVLVARMI